MNLRKKTQWKLFWHYKGKLAVSALFFLAASTVLVLYVFQVF